MLQVSIAIATCFRSLTLWNMGRYSDGLTGCAVSLEALMRVLDDPDSRSELAPATIGCFSKMASDAVHNDMTSALEFIRLASEKLTCTYNHPLVSYVFHIHLANSGKPDLREMADEIMEKFPAISEIRDEKFEGCLTKEGMTRESRDWFIRDFLARIIVVVNVDSSAEAEVKAEVLRDILDVKVLEGLRDGSGDVLAAIDSAVAKGTPPSDEVFEEVVGKYISEGNEEALEQLRDLAPMQTPAADLLFEHEITSKLRENHEGAWERRGEAEGAVAVVLAVYQRILEEEYRGSFEMVDKLLNR